MGLMTPVIKGVLTDQGFANTVSAQQIFGGHGYIAEHGMEQFVRDARIAMLYEGANGIQALDLVGRKLPKDGGRALQAFFAEVTAYIKERSADAGMAPFVTPLGQALGELQQATMWFLQNALGNPDNAGAGATDYMHLFGLVALGYMWCLIAEAAKGQTGKWRRRRGGTDGGAARHRPLFHGAACCRRPRRISRASRPARRRPWNCRRRRSSYSSSVFFASAVKFREEFMPDAFIYDHVRTPRGRGKVDGALHEVTALNLASQALGAIKSRNNLDTALVDDVVLGVVDPVGEAAADIARTAALVAGYGDSVPGVQINRFCASGLDAVNFAAAQIMSGQQEMAIGGGVESMSRVGIGSAGGAWAVDPSIAVAHYFLPQGISADLIATKYGFSRDDVDAYAVESQKRAAAAWEEGRFNRSVMPVKDVNGLTILAKDEHMRPGTTMQSLAALQPSFVQMGELGGFDAVAMQAHPEVEYVNHVHHAGNSSGIVDGAAAVLVGNKEAGQKTGLKPRARVRAFANIGSDPALMLTGPIDVTKKVLKAAGMTLADIDLIEINEAFASVVLRYLQAFDLDAAKVNVNGGAIALGHPLGATGAMILGTAVDEMERRNVSTGLVTLCIGAGMGTATIIERV